MRPKATNEKNKNGMRLVLAVLICIAHASALSCGPGTYPLCPGCAACPHGTIRLTTVDDGSCPNNCTAVTTAGSGALADGVTVAVCRSSVDMYSKRLTETGGRVCVHCATATRRYFFNTTSETCVACAEGFLAPVGGTVGPCTVLDMRFFTSGEGTAPRECPPNFISNAERTGCERCPGGFQRIGTATTCTSLVLVAVPYFRLTQYFYDVPVDIPRAGFFVNSTTFIGNYCAPGTANPSPSAPSCPACTPGRYTDVEGAHYCFECPPGTATAASGSTSCQPCVNGTVASVSRTACELCPDGMESRDGGVTCAACANGTYRSSLTSASGQCESCPVATEPTHDRTACAACPAGYNRTGAQPFCVACTDNMSCRRCPAGTRAGPTGECVACSDFTYRLASDPQDECVRCPSTARWMGVDTPCVTCEGELVQSRSDPVVCTPPDTIVSRTGYCSGSTCVTCTGDEVVADTEIACASCPEGEIRVPGQRLCVPCPLGQFELDGVCVSCRAGTHRSDESSAGCVACSVNHYANTTGLVECVACPKGFEQPSIGQGQCEPCPHLWTTEGLGDSCRLTYEEVIRKDVQDPIDGNDRWAVSEAFRYVLGIFCGAVFVLPMGAFFIAPKK